AAYYVYHQLLGKPRCFEMEHPYTGPSYSEAEIEGLLKRRGCAYKRLEEAEIPRETAALIAEGNVVGWFQGGAEWGPRALGNRSIVADPRRSDMKEILNRRIKHREIFRPFAPSILAEATGEWFEKSHPSPFMTLAYAVRPEKRAAIPAPTHVDG